MASRVTIKASCLRDASYVLGNLNPDDLAEVRCQLPAHLTPEVLAYSHVNAPRSAIAYVDDAPAMFFGVGVVNAACATVWAVGTRKSWRAVPEVTRFWHSDLVPWLLEHDFRFAEARSLETNARAHSWMRGLGAVQHGPAMPFGTRDEPFLLFRWTVAGYRSIYPALEVAPCAL